MKNILIFLSFISLTFGCKAQTPVIPFDVPGYGEITGAYYKDTQNFLNQYEGIWLYSQNGTELKIVLQKIELFHKAGGIRNFYTDYIIGEYQYKVNGIEIQNTLSNLNSGQLHIYDYNIYGNGQSPGNKIPTPCPECLPGEKKLRADYTEPSRRNVEGLESEMVFRRFTENGVVKLKVWFYPISGSYGYTTDGQPTDIDRHLLPYGEYIFTKQL